MKQGLRRMMAAALVFFMVLSVMPVGLNGEKALAVGAYGKTTANGVRVRKQPSTSADYWFKIDNGYVCEVKDVVTSKGVTWYKVNVEHPDPGSTRTYIGYIHGDFFTPLTDEEAAAWEANPVQPGDATPTPTVPATLAPVGTSTAGGAAAPTPTLPSDGSNVAAGAGATGQITNGGVNFRVTPGGDVISKLDRDTVVELLTIPQQVDENHWYKIRYAGREGYVQAPFIRVISTGTPGGATMAPGTVVSRYGYVKLILSSANLRLTPSGRIGAQWEKTGEVLEVTGPTVDKSGYTWYPVNYGGNPYYVRSDCVQLQAVPDGSLVTQPPVTQVTAAPSSGYVITTKAGVNLRLQPAGEMIQQIKRNTVLPLLASPVTQSGYTWYYVQAGNVRGYMRGDCVKLCNADGSSVTTPSQPEVTTPTYPTTNYGYVKTTKAGVNLRIKPTGSSQEQIARGVVLPMTGAKIKSGKYDWYPVRAASGRVGYLRGDCVTECGADGGAVQVTTAPTANPGVTTAPTNPPTLSSYGYVHVTQAKVNVRKSAGGSKIGRVDKNTVWPMTGPVTSTKVGGYYWFPVNVNGMLGYIRSDCCYKMTPEQEAAYLASGAVPGGSQTPSGYVNYIITTLDSVNLRASASKDAQALFNVPQGTVMAYNTTSNVGGSLWYRVVYQNTQVWVLGSCARVMTETEYNAWVAANPANTPQPDVIVGYVKTTAPGVNLRSTANGAKIIARIDKGVVVPYLKAPEIVRNVAWYYVKTASGYGYLHGDFVEVCDGNGGAITTPAPTNTPTGGDGKPVEASYTTLRRGSTGTAVRNLVTELKRQGYYSGEVTSSYTSAVETAVKNFQRDKGLTVDGIAGSATQHTLYGTVPEGTSDLTMTIYPAEKIDWYTGGIQSLWAKGATYKVYDVKTGIVWQARRWSGANHADVEPLTAADTARLCKIYGVNKASEIESKNLWQRRPCLVTIGNRTFACSLYGMPHNYPDGDTIPNNDMNGQICIHFTNSRTHTSNKVDTYHEEAIQYALDHAPNGKK